MASDITSFKTDYHYQILKVSHGYGAYSEMNKYGRYQVSFSKELIGSETVFMQ